jgi:hypothetical protein
MAKKRCCPYCFHPSLDELSEPKRRHQQSLERIDHLYAKIQSLDQSVAALSKQRARLLQELNGIRPLISTLPRETLSLIFQFVCQPPAFGGVSWKKTSAPEDTTRDWYFMYSVLSDVSTYWRETLMSTPQLWNAAELFIDSSAIRDDASYFSQFLEYSGKLPLTFAFYYLDNFIPPTDILIDTSIDNVLQENFCRIQNLHLTDPPQRWFSETSFPSLSKIIHFSLKDTKASALPSIVFGPSHSPTELTLVNTPNIKLSSLPLITTLNLWGIPLDTFYHILTQCPGLTKIYAYPSPLYDATETSPPAETFVLPQLESMDWFIVNDTPLNSPWQTALLKYIYLPALKNLSWNHDPLLSFPEECVDAARTFFTRLPIALAELELSGMRDGLMFKPFAHILTSLHNETHITHLIFTDCVHKVMMEVLAGLELQCGMRFPMLRTITINKIVWSIWFGGGADYAQIKQDTEAALVQLLGNILRCRLSATSDSSVLVLNVNLTETDSMWIAHAESAFAELKNYRSKLEIYVNSKHVAWW